MTDDARTTRPATSTTGTAGSVRPADRYGDRPGGRRVFPVAVAVTLAVLGLAWVGWAGVHHATPPARWQLLRFSAVDDGHLEMEFEVTADSRARLECDLRALDRYAEVVGARTVVVGPGPSTRRVETILPTRDRAVTGEVQECRVTGQVP